MRYIRIYLLLLLLFFFLMVYFRPKTEEMGNIGTYFNFYFACLLIHNIGKYTSIWKVRVKKNGSQGREKDGVDINVRG